MKEFKKYTTPTTTRYVLESMTAGATGASNIATSNGNVGSMIKRQQESKTDKVPQKPRQGPLRPQTGGGRHKDKKRADKQGQAKHKKPYYEDHEVSMASNELKSIHANAKKLLGLVQQYGEQGDLEAWQQSKITKAADYLTSVLQSIGGEQDELDELKGDPNKPDAKKIGHFQNLLKTQKDRFAQQGFARAANDTEKLQKKYREPISELEKPSGTLYIILLRDRTESVRVVGDFGTFPAEVQARAGKVGIKDKEGRKERPLKVNFLMTSASQALAELDKALADVDFIGGEKAEFVFKNSAFETDIEPEVQELHDLISSGADERFKNYEEPEVGSEPDHKPKGVDHFVVGPDGKRRRVPIPGKPNSQMGGRAVEQPKTYTYKLQRTDLAPKLRDMGFKFDGNSIILSKQQRDQLLAKMGDKQFGMIFGQGDRFSEGGRYNPLSFSGRMPATNRIPQDSTAGQAQQQAMVDQMKQRTINYILNIKPGWGRSDLELMTAAELNQILRDIQGQSEGAQKKPNATTRHLRDYPVSDKDVAKPVKKPEKKKPEQGVAEGSSENAWNAGISDEDFINKFGRSEFNRLTKKYGISSIPVPDLVGYRTKEPTDPKVRLHRGLDGPGAKLKSIIKQQGVAEGSPQSLGTALRNTLSRVEPGSKLDKKIRHHNDMVRRFGPEAGLMTSAPDGYHIDKKGFVRLGQGVAEDSDYMTDNMVSHITQIITHLDQQGGGSGDRDTFMKLVARKMPRIVQDNPKLFRRAFGIAYDRYFHIDQDDDDFDYTDYSMHKGERGLEEDKQKGVDGKACWKGYKRMGTKKKGGRTVDNCVKMEGDTYSESLWLDLSLALQEKAPPGDKYERMVKHIKKGYAKDGKLSDKERSIAYATAWKAKNKSKK